MKILHLALASVALASAAGCARTPSASTTPTSVSARPPIAAADLEQAQRAWCDALVELSRIHSTGGDAKAKATEVIDGAYNYAEHPVLFKPTLTYGEQTFRMDKAGALAYFVGGDAAYPNDKGFALKGWVSCTPVIRGWFAHGEVALAQGNVTIVDGKGGRVVVDKTFGYKRDDAGRLRIVLHHSSLPYQP